MARKKLARRQVLPPPQAQPRRQVTPIRVRGNGRAKGITPPTIGGGASVRYLDREIIRVSHAYIFRQVDSEAYFGNLRLDVFDSPVVRAMASGYTRYRFRYVRVDWQPVVSNQSPGAIAFTCSTVLGFDATPSFIDLGSMPNAHVGTAYTKGQSVCDTRVFDDEWYNIIGGHGSGSGLPHLIWTSIGLRELNTTLGYFMVGVTIEFASPAYVSPTLTTATTLKAQLDQLQQQIEELKGGEEEQGSK